MKAMQKKIVVKLTAVGLVLLMNLTVISNLSAQQKSAADPCNDSLYLRLKDAPSASLTDSQKQYMRQKEADCAASKAAQSKKPDEPAKADEKKQSDGTTSKDEPLGTTRNFIIIGVIVAAVAGLVALFASQPKSPFNG
jgi:uncharacterized membrane protein